jgi:hypothetical protein
VARAAGCMLLLPLEGLGAAVLLLLLLLAVPCEPRTQYLAQQLHVLASLRLLQCGLLSILPCCCWPKC